MGQGNPAAFGRSQAELCAAARFPTFVGFFDHAKYAHRKMLAVFQDFKDLRAEAFLSSPRPMLLIVRAFFNDTITIAVGTRFSCVVPGLSHRNSKKIHKIKSALSPQVHNKSMSPLDPDSRTAVYDISARRVYLPNGEKLEAHSGLGDKIDDPRYVHVKMRGPTPPNVYDLTLREKLFHGVRAIRLNPVDDSKMFRRDGILAHPYMLGSNGQSNGCVVSRITEIPTSLFKR